MKSKRRDFLKIASLAGLGIAGGPMLNASGTAHPQPKPGMQHSPEIHSHDDEGDLNLIGVYGKWAVDLTAKSLPSLSFRNKRYTDVQSWQKMARKKFAERLASPVIEGIPEVTVTRQYTYDGLHIEELTWQLPYGRPTHAILLKPLNAKGPLPGILAFHDHGGNKYLGTRKITRTTDELPPFLQYHFEHYYEKRAWANEVAKRGYVVLVSDAFTFASRRVMLQDVPARHRYGLTDADPENPANIEAYNKWASDHEHIMAKSLFSAGTTWPGVFLAEDRKALDVLCARKDVDTANIGCGGLSGGGLRTVMAGGMDPRIKCAVCVGFMTTWKDFILNKSFTHTWMAYVPLSPNELEFPEILGLRAPLPTLVLNNNEDQLYTLPEMKRADGVLKEVFAKANASDKYKSAYFPGEHKFDLAMQNEAFEWFDKWLK